MSISRLAFASGLAALLASGLCGAPAASAAPSDEATTAINERFTEFGGSESLLGNPVGAATDIADGAERDYAGGTIFYSADTGAHVMHGGILDKYRSLGGPAALGFPRNDESGAGDGTGRFNDFARPGGAAIYWSPQSGAHLMRGEVLDAWTASGGVEGPFGYPTTDTAVVNGIETGQFSGPGGTEISWSETNGLTTQPPALAASLPGFRANAEGGAVPNPNIDVPGVPSPNIGAPEASSSGINRWWAVPIGLAITAVAGGLLAMLGGRRRGPVTAPSMSVPKPKTPNAKAPEATVPQSNPPRMTAPSADMPNAEVRKPGMSGTEVRRPNTPNVDAPQWQNPEVGTGGGRHAKRETTRLTPLVGDDIPPLTDGRTGADQESGTDENTGRRS
ncbi:hypothetical protein HLB23_37810 [Nocardia uniformis]|uniref:LGFP repeat-containing protein n=1 Tax=Nocardia uniformis TaxID=53432 RepID=A0A849C9Q1_9NOCA|nr:hypothetical protein [Nocardia uniformis]NNH75543.1 hypothetical protein [Nocardia uniformis]